jgi:hypothetical protein
LNLLCARIPSADSRLIEATACSRANASYRGKELAMNSPMIGLRSAGVVFGLMCLAQILRLVMQPTVQVAGHLMPLWPSVLAAVILAGLAYWMWNLSRFAMR